MLRKININANLDKSYRKKDTNFSLGWVVQGWLNR